MNYCRTLINRIAIICNLDRPRCLGYPASLSYRQRKRGRKEEEEEEKLVGHETISR